MQGSKLFSVVIPAYNEKESLELLLACLQAQTIDADLFECLIVDDCSTDGSAEFLSKQTTTFELRTISHTKNLGRSEARNTGWRAAVGDIIVFLDADMLPSPQWLEEYRTAFFKSGREVISGGRYSILIESSRSVRDDLAAILEEDREHLFKGDVAVQFQKLHRRAQLGPYPNQFFNRFERQLREICDANPKSVLSPYSFMGSNIAVSRKDLLRTNGFVALMRRMEDTELGHRFLELGLRFGYANGANAYHLYRSGGSDRIISSNERQGYFYRHPYHTVALVYLWSVYNTMEGWKPQIPFYDQLVDLPLEFSATYGGINAEFLRLFKRPIPASCDYDFENVVHYFQEVLGVSASITESCLTQATAKGVITERRGKTLYFDIHHTVNWLRRCAGLREHEVSRLAFLRAARKNESGAGDLADGKLIKVSGSYEFKVNKEILETLPKSAALTLPVPQNTAYQTNVVITKGFPKELFSDANFEAGKFLRAPLEALKAAQGSVRYEFECLVRRAVGPGASSPVSPEVVAAYLTPLPSEPIRSRAQALLKRVWIPPFADAEETARRIHHWILERMEVWEGEFSEGFLMETGVGAKEDWVKLFVTLCRMLKIPARANTSAAFISHGEAGNHVEIRSRGRSPFQQNWAEFYSRRAGWVPVDFSTCEIGLRSTRGWTEADSKRQDVSEAGGCGVDSFGGLDPYRIHTSDEAGLQPLCLAEKNRSGWRAMTEVFKDTSHALICDWVAST